MNDPSIRSLKMTIGPDSIELYGEALEQNPRTIALIYLWMNGRGTGLTEAQETKLSADLDRVLKRLETVAQEEKRT